MDFFVTSIGIVGGSKKRERGKNKRDYDTRYLVDYELSV